MNSSLHRRCSSVLLALLASISFTATLPAEPLRIAFPPGIEQQEGDDWGAVGHANDYYRTQTLYSAAGFEALMQLAPSHHWLIGVAFRPDESVIAPTSTTSDLILSVATLDATALDTVFANNTVNGLTEVFNGTWEVTTQASREQPNGPYDFDMFLPFDRPYQYDPRQGSLLSDVLVIGGAGIELVFDGQTTETVTSVSNFKGIDYPQADEVGNWVQVIEFTFAEPGDVNGDLVVNQFDIDLLSSELRSAGQNPRFDLNDDGTVSPLDHTAWVHDERSTWYGDANLDGEFNSADLVAVLATGQYEDAIIGNSGWAQGDWDADGEFTSGDLVVALQDGGYEQGPRVAAVAVPEPSGVLPAICGFLACLMRPLFFRRSTVSSDDDA